MTLPLRVAVVDAERLSRLLRRVTDDLSRLRAHTAEDIRPDDEIVLDRIEYRLVTAIEASNSMFVDRTFFGVHIVTQDGAERRLLHGTTLHGIQDLSSAEARQRGALLVTPSPATRHQDSVVRICVAVAVSSPSTRRATLHRPLMGRHRSC